jgi:hypothetical protein
MTFSIACSPFLLFLALLPYFAYQAARRGKYAAGFRQHMGLLPESLQAWTKPYMGARGVGRGVSGRETLDNTA